MKPLRRRMIDDMTLRNFTPLTIQSYVRAVARFARYFNSSPDLLGPEHVRMYLLYLVKQRHVSLSYYQQIRSALQFFYRVTLGRSDIPESIPPVKQPRLSQSSSALMKSFASLRPSQISSIAPSL